MTAQLAFWIPRLVPKNNLHISGTAVAFSPAAVRHLPAAVQSGLIDAFAHSLHTVFLWATPIALCTLPFILILKELPLRDKAYIQSATLSAAGEGAEALTGERA